MNDNGSGAEAASDLVRVSPSAKRRVESVKEYERETFNDCLLKVLDRAGVPV